MDKKKPRRTTLLVPGFLAAAFVLFAFSVLVPAIDGNGLSGYVASWSNATYIGYVNVTFNNTTNTLLVAGQSVCTNTNGLCSGGTDGNNYTTGIAFTQSASTYTLQLSRSGANNLSASFTVPASGGSSDVTVTAGPNWPIKRNATNSSVLENLNLTCSAGYALSSVTNNSVCTQFETPASAAATYYPLTNPAGYNTGTVTNIATGNGLTGGPITTTGTLSISAAACTAGNYSQWNGTAFNCKPDTNSSGSSFDPSGLYANITGLQSANASMNASILTLQVRVDTINSTSAKQTYLDSLTANFTGNQSMFNSSIQTIQVRVDTLNTTSAKQTVVDSLVLNFTGNQSQDNATITALQIRVNTINNTYALQAALSSIVNNFTGNQSLFNSSIQTVQVRVDTLNSTKAGSNSSACPSGYYVSNVTTSFSGINVTCALDQSGSGGGGGNMSTFLISNGSVTSNIYNLSTLSIAAGSNIAVGLSGNTFTVSSTAAGGGPFDATNNLTADIRLGNYRLYTSNTGTAYISVSPSFAPRMYFNGGGEAIEWDNYQYILLANQYNEFRSFNTDNAGVNITNTGGGEGVLYVNNEQVVQPWDERVYYQKTEWESVTTGIGVEPWVPTAVSSGTTALVQGNYSHPGMATVSNALGTAAGSGYCYVITGATTFVLGPGYEFTYIGQPRFGGLNTLANGTTGRLGWFDVSTHAAPTDALFWNVTVTNSTTWLYKPMSAAGSSRTQLTGYNWTPRTNYDFPRINIKIINNTLAVFSMYNSSRSLLYTDNITTNIPVLPSQSTSNGVCFHATAGAAARVLAQHDFMSLGITGMVR